MISILLNLRSIILVSIALIAMAVMYMNLNSKEKSDYEKRTGQITFLDKQYEQLPVRDLGKYRYLKIDSYEYPFELFIGNASGDFKPKFEQIDQLKQGDTITVFYYETESTLNEGINRFIQFIDKENSSYFERGDSSKTIGWVVISICILLIAGGVVLWRMEKIRL